MLPTQQKPVIMNTTSKQLFPSEKVFHPEEDLDNETENPLLKLSSVLYRLPITRPLKSCRRF